MNAPLFRTFATTALAAACLAVTVHTSQAAEPAAVARAGQLTLTRSQAEMFDRVMPGRVIWVDVVCCSPAAIDDALATAELLRIIGGMSHAAPVFLTGRDGRHTAAAAERIAKAGMPLVFLVADDAVAMADTDAAARGTP